MYELVKYTDSAEKMVIFRHENLKVIFGMGCVISRGNNDVMFLNECELNENGLIVEHAVFGDGECVDCGSEEASLLYEDQIVVEAYALTTLAKEAMKNVMATNKKADG